MTFNPRPWQSECQKREDEFWDRGHSKVFFLEACPAAGKSTKAAMTARAWLDAGIVDCVIIAAPWKSIIGSIEKAATEDGFNLIASRQLFNGSGYQHPPREDVVVITYSSLCKRRAIDALQQWVGRHSFRFGLIVDEIHHGNVVQNWGRSLAEIGEYAQRIMIMSGTPFRSDKMPIQFVTYHSNTATPDFQLTYYQAVQHGYVRHVACRYASGDYSLRLTSSGAMRQKRMDELNSAEVNSVAKVIFNADSAEFKTLIEMTHSDMMRMRTDPMYSNAAALFVCRTGKTKEESERHVIRAARAVEEITGIVPEVVTHTDTDAEGKINRFRKSDHPYLVAVNMVSEGCDIPRIHAVTFLRLVHSEMLFRQIVGRALRRINRNDTRPAMIYLPKIKPMAEWATQLYEESDTAIREMKTCPVCKHAPCDCITECGDCGLEPCQCVRCEDCGHKVWRCSCEAKATHDVVGYECLDGGGHFVSDEVSPSFIAEAEYIASNYPQHRAINTVALGHLLQVHAMRTSSSASIEQKKASMLAQVNRLVNRVAAYRFSGDASAVFSRIVARHVDDATEDNVAALSIEDLIRIARALESALGD